MSLSAPNVTRERPAERDDDAQQLDERAASGCRGTGRSRRRLLTAVVASSPVSDQPGDAAEPVHAENVECVVVAELAP